ncbi:MAG: hypothetical protein NUK57_01190, partial [Gudongella sp.]|nr:hypothetical protein [Gudongella sp.]
GVLLIGGIFFMVPLRAFEVLVILIFGIGASVPLTMIGMAVDIIRPMTEWTNPQQAMKQNLNVIISMAIGTLYIFGAGFLGYLLLADYGLWMILSIFGGIIVASTILLYRLLVKLIHSKFMNME